MIRTLQPGQRCEVWIASVNGQAELAYSTDDVLLEAPNWALDGVSLILNGDGKMWRFDLYRQFPGGCAAHRHPRPQQ